jgi:glycosyltransferase involved in cell wall biosynthesis
MSLPSSNRIPLIVGSKLTSATQGHSLLGAKLRSKGAKLVTWENRLPQRFRAKLLRRFDKRCAGMNPEAAFLLYSLERHTRRDRTVHMLWGDDHLVPGRWPERSIFTLHQPFELWNDSHWERIGRSHGIITMADREAREINKRHPHVPTTYIPHGIDLEFWKPQTTPITSAPKQIAIVGRYMRNLDMLTRVVSEVTRRRKDVLFRWLVNPGFQVPDYIASQLPTNGFEFVRGLSDAQLRDFYQKSWVFFTPYNNVTASNAIVESMACGCPIFTTRVAGMPGYCEGSGAVMVENNDDGAMITQLERALDDQTHRDAMSRAARAHAERQFSWDRVAALHFQFYASLDADSRPTH